MDHLKLVQQCYVVYNILPESVLWWKLVFDLFTYLHYKLKSVIEFDDIIPKSCMKLRTNLESRCKFDCKDLFEDPFTDLDISIRVIHWFYDQYIIFVFKCKDSTEIAPPDFLPSISVDTDFSNVDWHIGFEVPELNFI